MEEIRKAGDGPEDSDEFVACAGDVYTSISAAVKKLKPLLNLEQELVKSSCLRWCF